MNKLRTILLVDDDEEDQLIFTSVIDEIDSNITCKCFSDALNGLQTLQTNQADKPACIFLDLNLPLMDGFEFLEIIKTSKELSDIPVIIYSTSSREADKVKAKALGASDFLTKQTSFTDLKSKVTDLLSTTWPGGN